MGLALAIGGASRLGSGAARAEPPALPPLIPRAALFGNPVALPLTRLAYDRFADLLYAWNRRNGRW